MVSLCKCYFQTDVVRPPGSNWCYLDNSYLMGEVKCFFLDSGSRAVFCSNLDTGWSLTGSPCLKANCCVLGWLKSSLRQLGEKAVSQLYYQSTWVGRLSLGLGGPGHRCLKLGVGHLQEAAPSSMGCEHENLLKYLLSVSLKMHLSHQWTGLTGTLKSPKPDKCSQTLGDALWQMFSVPADVS